MVRTPEISVVQENGNIRVTWTYPEDPITYLFDGDGYQNDWVKGYDTNHPDNSFQYNSVTEELELEVHVLESSGDAEEIATVTDAMIDLTGFDELKLEGFRTNGTWWTPTLNISDFSGEYYVRCHAYSYWQDFIDECIVHHAIIISTNKNGDQNDYAARSTSGVEHEGYPFRIVKVYLS